MLNKAYPPHLGGIERAVESLARGLSRRGVSVEVLVCSEDFSFCRECIDENLTVTRVRRCGRISSLPLGLGTFLRTRRLRPDVTHVHVPYPLGEMAALLLPRSTAVVATWHSDIVRQERLKHLYLPLQERFLRRADFLVPTSPPMLENSPQLSRYAEKCRVIHLGIELDRFEATPEREAAADALRRQWGKPTILFVGRLIEYKGLPTLIAAMRDVPARLEIVGAGRLHDSLVAEAKHLGLLDRIHFAGELPDDEVARYMRACAFLALPSTGRNETLGLVQLEAMACGRPVVSTNLPTGVPYANRGGETGLLVPPGNALALREAFLRLLADPAWSDALGAAARLRVREEFSAERMVQETLQLYEDALAKRSPHVSGRS